VNDLSELYSDMVPVDKLIQLNQPHHSAYWETRVNQAAATMERDMAEGEDQLNARDDPSRPEHYKTVDAAEEYNGMLV
jgi:hypothetical protein